MGSLDSLAFWGRCPEHHQACPKRRQRPADQSKGEGGLPKGCGMRERWERGSTRPALVDRDVERVRGRSVTRISPTVPAPRARSVAGDGPSDDPLPPVAAWVPRIRTRHLLTRARLIDAVAVNVWNGELIERGAPDLGTAREDDTETRTPRLSKHATLFNLDPSD